MVNHIVSYHIASLPIFLILITATISRRLTKGRTNRILFWIILMSFTAAFSDFLNYVVVQELPLKRWQVIWVDVCNYLYFLSRHSLNMMCIFFIYSVTHTWFRIKALWKRIIFLLPYLSVVVMYTANFWVRNLYTVTEQEGYQRGDAIYIPTMLVMCYMVFGIYLLIVDKKFLELSEWLSIASIYIFNILGILIQLFFESLIIESYFTAISILFLVLYVQKPEKQLDLNTGLPGFFAFRDTIKKIELTGEKVHILIVCIENADELGKFMGEARYAGYIHIVAQAIEAFAKKEKIAYEFYYEEPGMIYIITDDMAYNPIQGIPSIRERVRKESADISDTGMRVILKTVSVKFPEEVETADDVIDLGQRFIRYSTQKILYHAPQITGQRNYQIEKQFDVIYKRAEEEQGIEVSYAPIWSEKNKKNVFAEASIQIHDPEFGDIDEETVTEIARVRGAISVLDEYKLEQAFSYVGSGGMTKAGYEYIVVKLSAALGMQLNFTDQIWNLRSKYNVHPEQICFAFSEIGERESRDGLNENIKKLSLQGYRMALDGYSNGYLNIRLLSELSIDTVRIDKRLVADMETEGGGEILSGIINMLHSVGFSVVVPGIDDEETKDRLLKMGCNLMMGKLFGGEQS